MTAHVHERTNYSCGHLASQCRCMSSEKRITMLPYPCADCSNAEAPVGILAATGPDFLCGGSDITPEARAELDQFRAHLERRGRGEPCPASCRFAHAPAPPRDATADSVTPQATAPFDLTGALRDMRKALAGGDPRSITPGVEARLQESFDAMYGEGYWASTAPERNANLASEEARIAEVESRILSAFAAMERSNATLRERLRLVDSVCHAHHTASFMPEHLDVCPICTEAGGIEFYAENTRLYRAEAPHGPTD